MLFNERFCKLLNKVFIRYEKKMKLIKAFKNENHFQNSYIY